MKKLISLLGIVTITNSAIPSVIAASAYQKQENKLENSGINLQEINLKKLKRIKRAEPISTTIAAIIVSLKAAVGTVGTSSTIASAAAVGVATPFAAPVASSSTLVPLIISAGVVFTTAGAGVGIAANSGVFDSNPPTLANVNQSYSTHHNYENNYLNTTNINNSLSLLDFANLRSGDYLLNIQNIIRYNPKMFNIFGKNLNTEKYIFSLRKTNDMKDYIQISLKSRSGKETTVILNPNSNLYLDGFINKDGNHKTYYHFSEAKIKNIDGAISRSLGYNGDYPSLLNNELNKSIKINKNLINRSIENLSRINDNNLERLKDDLVRTIFVTSEAMRFHSIRNKVNQILYNNKNTNEIDFKDYLEKLRNWDNLSKEYTNSISKVTNEHIRAFNQKNDEIKKYIENLTKDLTDKKEEFKNVLLKSYDINNNIKDIKKYLDTTLEKLNKNDTEWLEINAQLKQLNVKPNKNSEFGRGNPDGIIRHGYDNVGGTIEVKTLAEIYEIDDISVLSSGSTGRLRN